MFWRWFRSCTYSLLTYTCKLHSAHSFFKERSWSNCDPQANFFNFRQWKIWYFWSSDVSQFYRRSHLCRRPTIHHIFLYLCMCDICGGRVDHATFLTQWHRFRQPSASSTNRFRVVLLLPQI